MPQVAPERLCALSPWRYSKVIWTESWTTGSRWPWLNSEVNPDDLQRSYPISTWFIVYISILFSSIISVSDVTKGRLRWKLRKLNLTDYDTTLVMFILTCKSRLILVWVLINVAKGLFIWKLCLALHKIEVILSYKVISPDLSLICSYTF